eukprot:755364-Hanusia_phi.AAC.2
MFSARLSCSHHAIQQNRGFASGNGSIHSEGWNMHRLSREITIDEVSEQSSKEGSRTVDLNELQSFGDEIILRAPLYKLSERGGWRKKLVTLRANRLEYVDDDKNNRLGLSLTRTIMLDEVTSAIVHQQDDEQNCDMTAHDIMGSSLRYSTETVCTRPPSSLINKGNEAGKDYSILFGFTLSTTYEGHHRGRSIQFVCRSKLEKQQWVAAINQILERQKNAGFPPRVVSDFARFRAWMKLHYTSANFQVLVAVLIYCNFILNMIESQSRDPNQALSFVLSTGNTFFTALFTLELAINMFSTLWRDFLVDPWNYFDFFVVIIGLLTLFLPNIPGGKTLRLTRAFRVFRLFKRIPSMRRIMRSLFQALPGMLNAYAIVGLLMSLFAIQSVTFFGQLDPVHFGSFFASMFTLWQVNTGDGWADIARSLFISTSSPILVSIFFVGFQLLITLTLINVVVCVLLDGFASSSSSESDSVKSYSESGIPYHDVAYGSPLKELARYFVFKCRDADELEIAINLLYSKIGGGELISFENLSEGLAKLPVTPPIVFRVKDWMKYVVRRKIGVNIEAKTFLNRKGFRILMIEAIRNLIFWHVNIDDEISWTSDRIQAFFLGLKARNLITAKLLSSKEYAEYAAKREYEARVNKEKKGIIVGTFNLRLVRAEGLGRLNMSGQPQALVEVKLGAEFRRSTCAKGSSNPHWNEVVSFSLGEKDQWVELFLWDCRGIKCHVLLGYCRFDISDIRKNGHVKLWLKLVGHEAHMTEDREVSGRVLVECEYETSFTISPGRENQKISSVLEESSAQLQLLQRRFNMVEELTRNTLINENKYRPGAGLAPSSSLHQEGESASILAASDADTQLAKSDSVSKS